MLMQISRSGWDLLELGGAAHITWMWLWAWKGLKCQPFVRSSRNDCTGRSGGSKSRADQLLNCMTEAPRILNVCVLKKIWMQLSVPHHGNGMHRFASLQ